MNKLAFEPESGADASAPINQTLDPANPVKWYVPRLRAAGVHFLLSFAVVLCALLLVVIVWYPGALLHASGGVKLVALMVVVDLILGPVLTFSVFNRKKEELAL